MKNIALLVLAYLLTATSSFAIDMNGVYLNGECRWEKPPMTRDQDLCHWDRSQECQERQAESFRLREERGKARCASRGNKRLCESDPIRRGKQLPQGKCVWTGKDTLPHTKEDLGNATCEARKTSEDGGRACRSKNNEDCLEDNQCALIAPTCYLKWKETSEDVDCKLNKDEPSCLASKAGYACGWGVEISNLPNPISYSEKKMDKGPKYRTVLVSCKKGDKKIFTLKDKACKTKTEWMQVAVKKCGTNKLGKLFPKGRCDIKTVNPQFENNNKGGSTRAK